MDAATAAREEEAEALESILDARVRVRRHEGGDYAGTVAAIAVRFAQETAGGEEDGDPGALHQHKSAFRSPPPPRLCLCGCAACVHESFGVSY